MKIEYRKQIDSETAPWQLLTNMDELLWNGVYALRVANDDGSHNLPFRLAGDDTVTLVVKDHAHEGMLENGRTVVQTITRVDRTSGNVYVYTRTRYNAGGTHNWSYWALAGEGNAALETPKASKSSLGSVIVGDGLAVDADGKVSLAAGAVGEEQLDASITAKIASMGDKLQHAASFAVNDGVALHIGALVENNTPYSGTNYRTYTDKLLSNGEHLIVNEGYSISTYKIFDGEQEIAFVANLDLKQIALDGEHLNYQLEFKKNDATAFASSELPVVIKYFRRNPIVWSAGSHIDNYIAPGTYNIRGDRTNLADGLPIYNTGSFSARLTVLAASNCVTQILTLLNVGGGDSNVYTRTRQGSNWGTWSKLQQNVEVGAIGLGQGKTFDHLTDNGMYSGYNVYQTDTDDNGNPIIAYETFVLVVINGYLTGGGISQLKYSLLQNGITTVATREKTGEAWCEWRDLDAVTTDRIQDGAVTAQKLSAAVAAQINNNTAAIVAERTRAMGQEGLLNSAFEAEKQRAVQAETLAVEKGKELALRALFIAAGAEYNDSGVDKTKTAPWGETVTHKAGHYYLNGLGDITDEQMMVIYNAAALRDNIHRQRYCHNVGVRTLLPFSGERGLFLNSIYASNPLTDYVFGETDNAKKILEVFALSEYSFSFITENSVRMLPASANVACTFSGCKALKAVCPINMSATTTATGLFTNCFALRYAYMSNLKTPLSFSDSPLIEKSCVLYTIVKALPTTAITITLHPDAYARLADDAEIIAALEAQPLISLVSA